MAKGQFNYSSLTIKANRNSPHGKRWHLIDQLGIKTPVYIKVKIFKLKMIQTSDYKRYLKEEFIPKEIRYLPEDIRLNVAYIVFDDKLYFLRKERNNANRDRR